MNYCCECPKGDIHKCYVFFIVGVVLLVSGTPLMVVGIAVQFNFDDFVAYVGAVVIFFGILFVFVWYMITIPSNEKQVSVLDEEDGVSTENEKPGTPTGNKNPAFEHDDMELSDLEAISNSPKKNKESISSDDVQMEFTRTNQPLELQANNNSNRPAIWGNPIPSGCKKTTDSNVFAISSADGIDSTKTGTT